jgi:uncharacterized protein YfdQ (DUF2303 family)
MSDNLKIILDAGAATAGIHGIIPDGKTVPLSTVPEGYQLRIVPVEDCEQWLTKPLRKKGTFIFTDVDSFIRYFNEHKSPTESRIFAVIRDAQASFRGVLNFHGTEPSFNDHACVFALTPTLEWQTWMGHNAVHMTQCEFAAFLEVNADVFTDPTGADLLELVQNLEGKSHVNIAQAIRLKNGAVKISYNEDVVLKGQSLSQAGEMEVPSILKLSIAPFEGIAPYPMQARLRYRIAEQKITFWYETIGAHLVVRSIAADVLRTIAKLTGVEPFKS